MTNIVASAKSVFLEAVDLSTPEERRKYLDAQCAHDPKLREHIEELLCHHGAARDFLESPPDAIAAQGCDVTAAFCQPAVAPGAMIGPYKLLEQIGEGGMGLVYMAEQQQPVKRLVALKLVKPGMDSQQVIARFEAERQALAMMDHPNIAKIYDAGTVGDGGGQGTGNREQGERNENSPTAPVPRSPSPAAGRPYFVMELVRGIPINEFCDQQKLTVRQRLALFIQVCQAVQHAHQKGIIHRDLKPTNVLVTKADTVPLPKVIDFGIAKALGPALTDHTLHTGFAQLVGTPLYMSPEQAELNHFGVDTRSDVYSLGVLLYELLTGTTPFDKERLKSVGFDEMRRIIREEEPETVSARIAKTRKTGTRGPGLGVEGHPSKSLPLGPNPEPRTPRLSELDWIVMKALEKDRTRRYESASALAADIQRYLSDEPVLACPPTAMYRFQKFARKHKPAFVTAAAIALCLILGTTVSAWQAVRATTAEAQASANEQKAVANAAAAEQKEQEAIQQRDETKALADKLQYTLYVAHMNLARHAWEEGAMEHFEELLAQYRPQAGATDLRGFEWHYLFRLRHGQLLSLKGHTASVNNVAYSPDGKRLATASSDKTIKLWDAETGREIRSIQGHSASVLGVAYSPDGAHLASASADKTVKVWDAETGRELISCSGHTNEVNKVAYSPDGKRLASVSDDTTVKVWDAQTGAEIISFKGHANPVIHVAFSPDGKRVASADDNDTTKVWDAENAHELLSIGDGGKFSFSPDGTRLITSSKVWDAQTGKRLLSLSGPNSSGMTVSPDGKRLANTAPQQPVRVYDAETGQQLFFFNGPAGGRVMDVAFSSDSKRLALVGGNGFIKIWDATTSPEARLLGGGAAWVHSLSYSPDGKQLAAGCVDRAIRVFDVQTGEVIHTLRGYKSPATAAVFSPDGKRLAAAGDYGEPLKVWDVQTGQELLSLPDASWRFAFSADGKRLACVHNGLKVWDAQTGQELLKIKEAKNMCVAFSPDGKLVATAGFEVTTVWDAQNGQELLSLKPGSESVAFSPDGKCLAGATWYDGNVRMWNAQTGKELLVLKGLTGQLNTVVFSPDGKRLAAQSQKGTLKVWDAQTGYETLSLKVDGGRGLAFSPNGHHLAAPGIRGPKIYDATPLPEKP